MYMIKEDHDRDWNVLATVQCLDRMNKPISHWSAPRLHSS